MSISIMIVIRNSGLHWADNRWKVKQRHIPQDFELDSLIIWAYHVMCASIWFFTTNAFLQLKTRFWKEKHAKTSPTLLGPHTPDLSENATGLRIRALSTFVFSSEVLRDTTAWDNLTDFPLLVKRSWEPPPRFFYQVHQSRRCRNCN